MTDVDELVRCITALLALNERNVLVPHGVPGLARDCLKSASAALERMREEARQIEAEGAKYFEWAMAAKMRAQDAEAEIERLREALKPFADIGLGSDPDYAPAIRLDRDAILAARQAFAQSLSDELEADMDDEFMTLVDRLLARLWMFGFAVKEGENG